MYNGDKWEFNSRQVSEVKTLSCPSVLLEWGRHDTAAYANFLRTNIANGNLGRWGAAAIISAIGKGSGGGGSTGGGGTTPVDPPPSTNTFPKTGNAFIDKIAPWAVESGKKHGIPPSVIIAQGILESGWGGSSLTKKSNAIYGVKYSDKWPRPGNPYVTGWVWHKTREQTASGTVYYVDAKFCSYKDQRDSTMDHGLFLEQPRYRAAKDNYAKTKDANGYLRDIRVAGYATDLKYIPLVTQLMVKYDLYRFDRVGTVVEPPPPPPPDPKPDPDPEPEPEKSFQPTYVSRVGSTLLIHLEDGSRLQAVPVPGGRWVVR